MDYKTFAIDLAKKAGETILTNFTKENSSHYKPDGSPVTEVDLQINSFVISEIKKHFPNHNIKGEEQSDLKNDSEFLWVCDPIDGTYNFAHHIPLIVFSLALLKDGQPILGVVFDPFANHLFYAEQGKGAFLNDKPISVSPDTDPAKNIVEISQSVRSIYKLWPLFKNLANAGIRTMRLGSTIYAGSMVANGNFIGMVFAHESAHDIAALKIIVEEAGGRVTDLFGHDQRYDEPIKGAIVSNGKIHQLLVDEIAKILKA